MNAREDEAIVVRGAREHNLREVGLTLPKNQLICFTGVSGSGKSSLAFDTLYAEGQRRYIESLSSYARQFMGQLAKPDVDFVSGLSPAISIEQKTGGANPRSTVGTITEIHDYLRVLFARVGQGYCPLCQRRIEAQSRDQIVSSMMVQAEGKSVLVLAPVVREQKGEFRDFFDDLIRQGYIRTRVDGEVLRLSESVKLDRQRRHNIEVIVDRLVVSPDNRYRLAEAVAQALKLSDGTVMIVSDKDSDHTIDLLLSSKYACLHCGIGFEAPTPQLFSFNSPRGMCPSCDGLGETYTFDPELLVPDPTLSFREGAVPIVGSMRDMGRWRRHIFEGIADEVGFSLDKPWKELPETARSALLHGTGDRHITYTWRSRGRVHRHGGTWEGIVPQLLGRYRKTGNAMQRRMLEKYMRIVQCPECLGARLSAQARSVKIAGRSLTELESIPVDELSKFIQNEAVISMSDVERIIAIEPLKEIAARLGFLENVGLQYLSLDRRANTLSGGEAQRIRLAGQIGSGLVGVLYVLDEPSIGLHPRDNAKLLSTLETLRDQGNTLIVVEHDEDTMRAADYLVDFGPGPGVRGGEIVAEGDFQQIAEASRSVTGQFLSGKRSIPIPKARRPVDMKSIPATTSKLHSTSKSKATTTKQPKSKEGSVDPSIFVDEKRPSRSRRPRRSS